MQRLQNTALSTKNISSALLLDTYTVNADRQIFVGVALSGLAGNGTYKICLTRQRAGAGAIYQSPTTAISLAATVTTAYLQTIAMPVMNTDVVKIYAVGLAGDTSVAGAVEVFDTTLDAVDLAAINAQADTALSDINLDHLAKTATAGVDMTDEVADGTILSRIISSSNTSDFVPATHSLVVVAADVAAAHAHAAGAETQATAAAASLVDGGFTDLLIDSILADTTATRRALVLNSTTIATLATQLSFTLTAGAPDNSAYPTGSAVVVRDASTALQRCVGILATYTGASKTVTLDADPGVYTMAAGDLVDIIASTPLLQDIDTEIDTIEAMIGNIAVTGAPSYKAAASFTITAASITETNTYEMTDTSNGINHSLTPVSTSVDGYYAFLLGGDEVAVSVAFKGRLFSNPTASRTFVIQAWDWVAGTPAWVTLETINAVNADAAANDVARAPILVSKYTGTGADIGKVHIRIYGTGLTTATPIRIDQLVVGRTSTSRTVGYADGAVWLNTNATANIGTESYVDGVADHPVTTIAAAITLADALGLKRIRIANGSAVTLTGTIAAKSLVGKNWTLALAGQAITGAYIEGATISGTSSGTGAEFVDCHFTSTQTVGGGDYFRCGFGVTTFTMLASSSYNFIACFDDDPDTATSPIFVFAASAVVGARNWRGAFQVNSMASTNKLTIDGAGRLVISDTSEGGAITMRGFYPPAVAGTGLHSAAEFVVHGGSITQTSRFGTDNTISADAVAISGDSVAADRLEAMLDATPFGIVVDDNDPDPSATAFETNLTISSDGINNAFCVFASGALIGESQKIADWNVTTKVLTTAAFTTAPTAGDVFFVIGKSA